MSAPDHSDARFSRAQRLLEEFMDRRAAGESATLDALLQAHPDLEPELRELHSLCRDVDEGLLEGRQAAEREKEELERLLSQIDSGTRDDSRYRVEGEVGQGGMGVVYRVIDTKLDRPLAMKVILGQATAIPTGKTPPIAPRQLVRFLNEAKITSQLDHPGIVPVHEMGVDTEGRAYFTMKLVKGRSLAEVLRLHREGNSEWSTPRILGLAQRVCEAVAYAHERSVVHRDLKPANIMVGDFGEVYVMDWGLARRVGGESNAHHASGGAELDVPGMDPAVLGTEVTDAELLDQVTLTNDGQIVGTPAYMPPEQAAGRIHELGPRSDVYAIGAMMYELLAGHAPYCTPGKNVSGSAVLRRVVLGPPDPLLDKAIPPELVAITSKAMAREPRDRYRDVRELGMQVQAFLEGKVVEAYETGTWAEAKKWLSRNKPLAASLVAGVLALAIGLAVASHQAAIARDKLEEVLSLSAIQELKTLTHDADELWPASKDKIRAYDDWLAKARVLIEGRPGDPAHGIERHPGLKEQEAKLVEIGMRAKKVDLGQGDSPATHLEFDNPKDDWWYAQLSQLVFDLRALADERTGLYSQGTSPGHGWGIPRRLAEAATIEAHSVTGKEERERWAEAIAAIARSPKYGGQQLAPQLGLLPIGADPASGLWEFAHLQTGVCAQRGPDNRLVPTDSTGLVFVLIPGGTFNMGAQQAPNGINHDDEASEREQRVRSVTLDAFFLSKYEMTQGQWTRMAGQNPSSCPAGKQDPGGVLITPVHPVETVSWDDCREWMGRFGLTMPTEAQWEYACRAGTSTPWFTGSDVDSLMGFANLADQRLLTFSYDPTICNYAPWNDGWATHAPVGSYKPNTFGLHDIAGNVMEWCLDSSCPYSVDPRAGDGERECSDSERVIRGGAWDGVPAYLRSAMRISNSPSFGSQNLGLRPARGVDR